MVYLFNLLAVYKYLCLHFLQVKMWYDKVGHQLIVNVLQAKDLPCRKDGRPRNPYVKMYFLPDRRCSDIIRLIIILKN